jgi:serine kinase of HPr protein (carbohydrate metabolism regulator)
MLLHVSCVAIDHKGVLIAGPSGAGKSDLALRLIDDGGLLVADDQTELQIENKRLMASPPIAIAGFIEVRHVGLLKMPYAKKVPVALYVDLAPLEEKRERLPDEETIGLLGSLVRRLRLPGLTASAPAKIRAFLIHGGN